MPKYNKFLKDFLINKMIFKKYVHGYIGEECSVILRNKILKKKKDPRSFTIPYMIGDLVNEKALVDLGASMNVIPYTIFIKLLFSALQFTRITLQ